MDTHDQTRDHLVALKRLRTKVEAVSAVLFVVPLAALGVAVSLRQMDPVWDALDAWCGGPNLCSVLLALVTVVFWPVVALVYLRRHMPALEQRYRTFCPDCRNPHRAVDRLSEAIKTGCCPECGESLFSVGGETCRPLTVARTDDDADRKYDR